MRVGIYARVSTEAQEVRGTIGSQLEALRVRVGSEGHELVAEYVDDGYSGARLDRPGLDALRDAAETGVIEAVWCLSPDRLARAYAYQVLILDEFARHQVPVLFSDAPALDDPQARLLVQVQGVIAEYERAKFAERERRGKLFRARAGEVLSRKVPYGYRRVPRGPDGPAHVIVHEPEAAVVRRIYAEFLAGVSIRRIAIELSHDGIVSPEGKSQWVLATIGRVLRNEAYVGRLFWNRTHTSYDHQLGRNRQTRRPRDEWVTIPVQAIIDDDTFEAARRAAADNSAFSPRRTEPDTFLLRRLVRCGRCGVKLACHRANRTHGLVRYYLCPHHDPVRAGGQDRRCPERRIRADELDSFVFEHVRDLLARPDLLAAGEAALVAQRPAPDDELVAAQLARIDRRIETADTERRRLADLYQAGVIDETDMGRRAQELQARHRRLGDERQALLEQRTELAQHNRLNQRINAFAQRALAGLDATNFEQRQQLLRLVLEDVRVEGWQVELRLRIPLDQDLPHDPTMPSPTSPHAKKNRPRGARDPKEAVSSNDGLRSIGQCLFDVPRLSDHTGVPARAPSPGQDQPSAHRQGRSRRTVPASGQPAQGPRQPRRDHPRPRSPPRRRRRRCELTTPPTSPYPPGSAANKHETGPSRPYAASMTTATT
jgi:site-specific DNA recombinase